MRFVSPIVAILAVLAFADSSFGANPTLYVSQSAAGSVLKVDSNGTASNFTSFITPLGLAVDSNGVLYAGSLNNSNIFQVGSNGSLNQFAFGFPLNAPVGMVFGTGGNLFTTSQNGSQNEVIRILPNGTASVFATDGTNGSKGLAVDSDGNVYAATGSGEVFKIAADGSVSNFAAIRNEFGLAFDHNGNLFVSDNIDNTISEVTPGGSISTFVSSGLNHPEGLAFDPSGNLFVADNGDNAILRITPGGSVSTFASGLNGPDFLAFAPEPSSMTVLAVIASSILLKRRARRTL
jgi:streptogramin lyase